MTRRRRCQCDGVSKTPVADDRYPDQDCQVLSTDDIDSRSRSVRRFQGEPCQSVQPSRVTAALSYYGLTAATTAARPGPRRNISSSPLVGALAQAVVDAHLSAVDGLRGERRAARSAAKCPSPLAAALAKAVLEAHSKRVRMDGSRVAIDWCDPDSDG